MFTIRVYSVYPVMNRDKMYKLAGELLIHLIRKLIFRLFSTKFFLQILGDIPRDLLDHQRGFSYDFFENGEFELIKRVKLMSKQTSVIFDVGANVGDYTQLFLDLKYDGQIHLFEIDNSLNEILNSKFENRPNLHINNFGLSDVEELRSFNSIPDYRGANSLFDVKYSHLKTVKSQATLMTGDSYCDRNSIDTIMLLKMDIEGWEKFALNGFKLKLKSQKIDICTWEYGYVSAESGWTTRNFYDFFESFGYVCGVLRKDGVDFRPWHYGLNDWKSGPNFLACLPHLVSSLK